MSDPTRPSLGQTGQIHVTLAAARSYAEWARIGVEEARRELLDLLQDARRLPEDSRSGLERWRMRRRSTRTDIEAHVSREDGVGVVTHVQARRQKSSNQSHRALQRPHRRDESPYRSGDE